MGFFSPWFLAGAAAVVLPVYLHLLRRHRANPQPFSSLMFFEQRKQSPIKHRRLRHLALLSLRLTLLLLLALAFANPLVRRSTAGVAGDKLLLLVIDNSFSMRAGSRLAEARRQAISVLDIRKPSDRAQVITLGSQLRALTQPTKDAAALRAAVDSVQPGDSRASFAELAHALGSVAESARTPIELHLFSDMQKSGMPGNFSELVLPANVSLVPHAVAQEVAPNWALESVDAPGELWGSKRATVRAVVAGYHTPTATRAVSLVVNGKVAATRSVEVPAEGRAAVEFPTYDVPYGFNRCEVRIDSADSLPADDVSLFAIQRSDPAQVLFVHEPSDSRSPFYFGTALASAPESAFTPETVHVDQVADVKLSSYAFVILSDLLSVPPSFEQALLRYVRDGGSVLIAAGTSSARGAKVPVFGGAIVDTRYYSRSGERFLTVGEADPSHPSIAKADRWSGVKFYFAVQVDPANSRVLARLTDQTPLLLEKDIGAGRVLLLASGLDNLTNDFPLHPAFVPFVDETARYLSGATRRSGARTVDSVLELRTAGQPAASVEVIDPDGRRLLSLNEAAATVTFQVTRTGFYEVRLADGRQAVIGVNADRRESDLDVMPNDVLSLWRANGSAGPQASPTGQGQEQLKPHSLWWGLMVLVLVAAIAESAMASQTLGRLREEP